MKTNEQTMKLITDTQTLTGAKSRFGHSIPTYDDGFGQLYIHRDSMGISGIVRAQSWEDAYSICEDDFFQAGDEDAAEEIQRIEAMPDGEEKNHAQACWDESYGYRGNGRKMADGSISSIYAKDLNGDSLELLTSELLAELEITLEIEDEKEPEPEQRHFLWHLHRIQSPSGNVICAWSGRYGTQGSSVFPRGKMRRTARKHDYCAETWN